MMKNKILCGKVGCIRPAEWAIVFGPAPDQFVESCEDHVSYLLTDAKEHRIYKIKAFRETQKGEKLDES